jgi:hypothetical protein
MKSGFQFNKQFNFMSLKNTRSMTLDALTALCHVKEISQIARGFSKHQHVILAIYVPS